MKKTGAVILAAGRGSRLGGACKATYILPSSGVSFLDSIYKTAKMFLSNCVLVTGGEHEHEAQNEAKRLGIATTSNPNPDRGMSSSIAVGFEYAIQNFNEISATFLWPVDYPQVDRSSLAALLKAGAPDKLVSPTHEGKSGHPPLIGRNFWPLFSQSHLYPRGARTIFEENRDANVKIPVTDVAILQDVDYKSDLNE